MNGNTFGRWLTGLCDRAAAALCGGAVFMGIAGVGTPAEASPMIPIASCVATGQFDGRFPCTATFDFNPVTGLGVDDRFPALGSTPPPVGSFWLGRQQTANETITFDLGGLFTIDGLTLYNTHNRTFNDRGTTVFSVWVSTTQPNLMNVATFGTEVLDNRLLTFVSDQNPNSAQPFDIADIVGQYVTFRADSFQQSGAGLSEFQVFGTLFVPPPPTDMPAPASVALLGFGLAISALLKRRSS